MEFTVPDAVLSETSRCPKNFACLSSTSLTNPEFCGIKLSDGRNVLFLQSETHSACPYCLSFGFGKVCTCPTRYAIYTNFKK